MISLVAGTVLSCALSASAILLPPSVASALDSQTTADGTVWTETVLLPCTSCAFPYKDYKTDSNDDVFHAQGSANLLAFNFSVTADRPTELQLNGHTIYPFDIFTELENFEDGWSVEQIPAATTDDQLKSGEYARSSVRITGAGISVGPVETFGTFQGDSGLVSLRWQLLSLDEHMMTVDPLYIQMFKSPDGKLELVAAGTVPAHVLDADGFAMPEESTVPPPPPPPPHHKPGHGKPGHPKPADCGFLPQALCDIGHRIGHMIHGPPGPPRKGGCHKGMKGGKKHPFGPEPPFGEQPPFGPPPHGDKFRDHDEPPHHEGPHGEHHGPHGPHGEHEGPHGPHDHHEHHRHGIFHVISRGILSIAIPIMAGITVGMIVSVLGLMFGRFIGWLCFTVIGKRRSAYAQVADDEKLASSKEVLVAEEVETLPLYEDAPAYDEVTKEDKV